MKRSFWSYIPTGIPCLLIFVALFGYIGSVMGVDNMLNTIMNTAHKLLIDTVLFLMGVCVVTGAIGIDINPLRDFRYVADATRYSYARYVCSANDTYRRKNKSALKKVPILFLKCRM